MLMHSTASAPPAAALPIRRGHVQGERGAQVGQPRARAAQASMLARASGIRIARLEGQAGQGCGEVRRVLAGAAGHLQHHAARGQVPPQRGEDGVAVSGRGRGVAARIARHRCSLVVSPGARDRSTPRARLRKRAWGDRDAIAGRADEEASPPPCRGGRGCWSTEAPATRRTGKTPPASPPTSPPSSRKSPRAPDGRKRSRDGRSPAPRSRPGADRAAARPAYRASQDRDTTPTKPATPRLRNLSPATHAPPSTSASDNPNPVRPLKAAHKLTATITRSLSILAPRALAPDLNGVLRTAGGGPRRRSRTSKPRAAPADTAPRRNPLPCPGHALRFHPRPGRAPRLRRRAPGRPGRGRRAVPPRSLARSRRRGMAGAARPALPGARRPADPPLLRRRPAASRPCAP